MARIAANSGLADDDQTFERIFATDNPFLNGKVDDGDDRDDDFDDDDERDE